MSPTAVLAAYIALWLKRCVVPSSPQECITIRVLYPAVQLVYGHSLGLLPAMVCCVQHSLRQLVDTFLNEPNSNPQIDLPYTYLMALFASDCQGLIPAGPVISDNKTLPNLCKWASDYLVNTRRLISHHSS